MFSKFLIVLSSIVIILFVLPASGYNYKLQQNESPTVTDHNDSQSLEENRQMGAEDLLKKFEKSQDNRYCSVNCKNNDSPVDSADNNEKLIKTKIKEIKRMLNENESSATGRSDKFIGDDTISNVKEKIHDVLDILVQKISDSPFNKFFSEMKKMSFKSYDDVEKNEKPISSERYDFEKNFQSNQRNRQVRN